jgi:hypothetical protein
MSESEYADSQSSEYLSEHDSDRDFIDDDQSQNPDSEFEASEELSSESFSEIEFENDA